jgi:hypothetical protein
MGTIGRHCEAHGAKIGVAPHASPAQLNQNAKALPVRKIALQSAAERFNRCVKSRDRRTTRHTC